MTLFVVTSFAVDEVNLLEIDAAFAGTVLNYRVFRPLPVNNGTLADCAALTASGWGSALNWVVPSTPSDWCCSAAGIKCGGADRRVTHIFLYAMQLTGICTRLALCVDASMCLSQ